MKKSKLIKKMDNHIYFKLFVALLWAKSILLEYIRSAVAKLPIFSAVSEYIIPCAMFLMFLLSFKTITERLHGSDFVFIMASIVVFVFEFWVFKDNRPYFEMLYMEFAMGCLPFYFVGVALRNDDESILKWLYGISSATILTFSFYMLFVNRMEDDTMQGGDMSSAYNILPHACLTFYYLMKKFKWRRLALFLVASIAILMMGSRGPVLCLGIYVIVVSALTIRLRRPYVLIGIILICAVFVLIPNLFDYLIQGAYALGQRYGLSTRFFDKMLSGNFTASSGRMTIRQQIRYYLRNEPIVGLGIYGDRYVTKGFYAHNLFLEIYAHFGYFLGTILSASFVILLLRGLIYVFKSKNESARCVSLLLLCCCCKLMVSNSYLREPFLWLMMGYFVALLREARVANLYGDQKIRIRKKQSKFVR